MQIRVDTDELVVAADEAERIPAALAVAAAHLRVVADGLVEWAPDLRLQEDVARLVKALTWAVQDATSASREFSADIRRAASVYVATDRIGGR